MKYIKRITAVIAACFVVILLGGFAFSACSDEPEPLQRSGEFFDTLVTVTVYDGTEEDLEGVFDLASKYENLFSTTIAASDVSRINAAKGVPVTVDPETAALIEKGLYYAGLSGGRFDITVGRLSALWQEAMQKEQVPSDSAVQEALQTVDYRKVTVSGNVVTVSDPDTEIDLGGIAKGYIADRMKEYLTNAGVTSALINLGGNILAVGKKTDGTDFSIGIQEPFSESGDAACAVDVSDRSVVTSGTYERYFTDADGKIYHHILDLSTGYPAESGLDSATVITDDSVDGDALSTICFLLGADDAKALLEKTEHAYGIFIDHDGEISVTKGVGSDIPFRKVEE